MSEEDRTQAPTKQRLQQARESGHVPHSAELTSAATLLAATTLLGLCGEPLVLGILRLIREAWDPSAASSLAVDSLVDHLRSSIIAIGLPLIGLIVGPVVAGIVAHQAQVRGLFAPALLAPQLGRLWSAQGAGLSARLGRGAWILSKTTLILVVIVWTLRSRFDALTHLGRLETVGLAQGWLILLREITGTLAVISLVLGLIDFTAQHRRFQSMLMLTPAQSREDQKATDGDPSLRSRRARIAKSWRGDAPELLAGCTLAVTGPGGLIVLLTGGPPPKRIQVRSSAKGSTGIHMRRSAEQGEIPLIENAALARRLVSVRSPVFPAELTYDLKAAWPEA